MKRVLISVVLKRSVQLLLSISLSTWLLSTGSLAYASSGTPQALSSRCPTIPANLDVAHTSTQELHKYLLPGRPTGQDAATWLQMMQGIKQTKCVPDMPTHPIEVNGRPLRSNPALVNCPGSAPSGTSCSNNWNGYTQGNGSQPGFNDVYGRWNVECVTGSQSPSDSAQSSWVGLGGNYGNDNLWQAGSSWDPFNGHLLWYEAVGANGTPGETSFASANCGDHIFSEVWFAPNDPTSNVGFVVIDNGTEYRGYAPSGFASGNLSAEWIDERPSCGSNNLYKLADYNYSEWTSAYGSPNDPNAGYYAIGDLAHTRWWMQNNDGSHTRIAWSNYLGSETGSGDDNYQAYWEANGSSQCG